MLQKFTEYENMKSDLRGEETKDNKLQINESPIDIFIVRSDICNLYDLAFCLRRIKDD